jgi:plasmid stability protein
MRTLVIRNIPEAVFERFTEIARRNHRNTEAHGRFLLERESLEQPAETGEELLAVHERMSPPDVDPAEIESFQKKRGRRSNRP